MTQLFINIQTIMKERNIKSLRQLEQLSGINEGTLKTWKNRLPRCESLIPLAKYFQMSLDDLLGLTKEQSTNCSDINPKLIEILNEAKSINIDKKTADMVMKILNMVLYNN